MYGNAYKLDIAMETASKDALDLQNNKLQQSPSIHKVGYGQKQLNSNCHRCHGQRMATVCRFREVNFRLCGKKGHIAKACHSKSISQRSSHCKKQAKATLY